MGSSNFETINYLSGYVTLHWFFPFLLVCGACFKSAQVLLNSWLYDAMEEPTPVSALLHSATLVAAPAIMLLKLHGVMTNSMSEVSTILLLIIVVGALLINMAASNLFDIKTILASSTSTQLSYILLALLAGSVNIAAIHFIYHAVFKSGLFMLVAIIGTLNSNQQDIRVITILNPLTKLNLYLLLLNLSFFLFTASNISKSLIISKLDVSKFFTLTIELLLLFVTTSALLYSLWIFLSLNAPRKYTMRRKDFKKSVPRTLILPVVLCSLILLALPYLFITISHGGFSYRETNIQLCVIYFILCVFGIKKYVTFRVGLKIPFAYGYGSDFMLELAVQKGKKLVYTVEKYMLPSNYILAKIYLFNKIK